MDSSQGDHKLAYAIAGCLMIPLEQLSLSLVERDSERNLLDVSQIRQNKPGVQFGY